MANAPLDANTVLKPEVAKPKLPPMFKVLLLNDDYTPMEFVVECLERFFNKNREQATQIMLKVHTEGVGAVSYTHLDVYKRQATTRGA